MAGCHCWVPLLGAMAGLRFLATLCSRTNQIPWLRAAFVHICIVLENLQFGRGPHTCGLYVEGSFAAASFLEWMK